MNLKAEIKDFFNRNRSIQANAPVIAYAMLHERGAYLDIDDIQAVLTDLENDGDIRDTSRPGWEYAKIYEVTQ